MASVTYHAFAALFPMLPDEQIQELADDIAKNGLRSPIVVDECDHVLDGRHRLAACMIAQVEPVYEKFIGSDEDKLAYVVSANLHRRHLTTSQKAMIASKLKVEFEKQAAERQKLSKGRGQKGKANLPDLKSSGQSRDKAAESVGVSGKSVDMATKVRRDGVPELAEAVTRGQVAISAAAEVAELPQDRQREIVSAGPEAVKQAASEARASKVVHVSQNSGNDEWYTPKDIIELARSVMGSIDTDPASCETANKIVKAGKFFDVMQDGLSQKWSGNVWMNPPYSRGLCSSFVHKLIEERESGNISQAIAIANNATETEWGQLLLKNCDAICFRSGRVRFLGAELEPINTPLQGQMICYFGNQTTKFRKAFEAQGVVLS